MSLVEHIKDAIRQYRGETRVWKCGDCLHANKSIDEVCYWCGSGNRQPIYPVKECNVQQGTPDYVALSEMIDKEEANRMSDEAIEAQIEHLIEEFLKEKNHGEANCQSTEGHSQVGLCSIG